MIKIRIFDRPAKKKKKPKMDSSHKTRKNSRISRKGEGTIFASHIIIPKVRIVIRLIGLPLIKKKVMSPRWILGLKILRSTSTANTANNIFLV